MLAKLPHKQRIIADMADYIEEHGWCQRQYWNDSGAVCILGALANVAKIPLVPVQQNPNSMLFSEVQVFLNRYAGRYGYRDIVSWNDAAGRTKQQVIDKLREIAYAG